MADNQTAPTDAEQAASYEQICELARNNALILNAAGGVVTIVHPATQRAEGLYEHIQYVHGLGKHPKTLAEERAAKGK
jgi:hypothetical protein